MTLQVCCELLAGFIQRMCIRGFIFVVFYFGADCPKVAGSSMLTLSWLLGGPPHRAHAGSTSMQAPSRGAAGVCVSAASSSGLQAPAVYLLCPSRVLK